VEREDGSRVLHFAQHKTVRHIGEKDVDMPVASVELLAKVGLRSGRLFGDWKLRRFQKYWEKIREAADCPDLQMRDARRTFASFGLGFGLTLAQIGELLRHTDT
jgi:hypothetical protein